LCGTCIVQLSLSYKPFSENGIQTQFGMRIVQHKQIDNVAPSSQDLSHWTYLAT